MQLHQVTSLPGTMQPDSIYAVLAVGSDEVIALYITDDSGNAKRVGNELMKDLPSSDPLVAGEAWLDYGFVRVSTGE